VPALLTVRSIDVNQGTKNEELTQLHYAAYNGDAGVVRELVKLGAKVKMLKVSTGTAR
jgi:hypothetical protein